MLRLIIGLMSTQQLAAIRSGVKDAMRPNAYSVFRRIVEIRTDPDSRIGYSSIPDHVTTNTLQTFKVKGQRSRLHGKCLPITKMYVIYWRLESLNLTTISEFWSEAGK